MDQAGGSEGTLLPQSRHDDIDQDDRGSAPEALVEQVIAPRRRPRRNWDFALTVTLVLQAFPGIANVLACLPRLLAFGHNLGAALLLLHVVAVNKRLAEG